MLLAVLAGCRGDRLRPGDGDLRLSPDRVELGEVYLGDAAEALVEVQNTGAAPLVLTWSLTDPAFTLDDAPERLAGGEVARVRVHAAPAAAGVLTADLDVSAEQSLARTTLTLAALARPDCLPSGACVQSAWSSAARACVETPVPDGLACTETCLTDATCVAGHCVGDERSCRDTDACTVDLCQETTGCLHLPAPPCPGDGRCQVGVCNPARGCELEAAPDGALCGRSGCTAADVCVAGACVERDPPDGFVCAEASPCQAEGRCAADLCVRPAATPLRPSWDFGGPLADGGAPEASFSDLFLEPTDAVALSGYFTSAPVRDARSATPVRLSTPARRCLDWQGVLACADHPTTVAAGVSTIDAVTGAPKWTYGGVLADLPQLVAADRHTYLARLVVLSAARLAAVFETGRVLADGADSLCRAFSVVVLNRFGAKVSAWVVDDPLLARCNHPHSFGAASDAVGNLYFAFTASGQANPAEPALADTLLASYTEAGALRWKGVVPSLPGGELAVARGVLLHQHAVTAFSTADGSVVGLLPDEFHHGVSTRDALIAGPVAGSQGLSAFSHPSLAPAWTFALPAGEQFSSDLLRLAAWTTGTGARGVALGFTRASSALFLRAVDTATGREAFSCPVELPSEPLAFEVGRGGLGLMTAYAPPQACLVCDPRFAGTRNRFFWLALPLVDRAAAPWPGMLGGPGHDHHEDAVP